MSRFLFCSEPFHGHVSPVLHLVQELVQRGEVVSFYTTEPFREAIQATGATFHPIPETRRAGRPGSLEVPIISRSHEILQAVVETAQREAPDCFVYDAMSLWGLLLARILHVPAARIHVHFPVNAQFRPFDTFSPRDSVKEDYPEFERDLQQVCASYDLPPLGYHEAIYHAEPLNIARFLQDFFPAPQHFDARFHFVGPFLAPPPEADTAAGEPLLYISLGTVNTNIPPFFDICLTAFGKQSLPVVMATGSDLDYTLFGPLPEQVTMRPQVSQMQMLQRAAVFITHGGMNSIMEALYYGVPMVVVPFSLEQMINARRVEELHLGVVLRERELTSYMLQQAVARVQDDPAIHAAVKDMQQRTRQAAGSHLAADLLIQACG